MDPISQGTLGAAAALSLFGRDRRLSTPVVAWLGALSAMAPDLDVLIRSSEDPLLAIKYHRHFTHSLTFVPLGAALALLPWLLRKDIRKHLGLAWVISAIAYATHAPLDCCTTYGTQYFWPFSDYRVSLSFISVVDPVYTIPLLCLVILAARRHTPRLARLAFLISTAYLALGAFQKHRAQKAQSRLIDQRGHETDRREVFTTFMNQLTWRSLYEAGGTIYVDRIHVSYLGASCISEGATTEPAAPPPPSAGPTVQRGDRLMRWFSSGWVAHPPDHPNWLGDLRYSAKPEGLEPFWAVAMDVRNDTIDWVTTHSERSITVDDIVDLIFSVPSDATCY